MGIEGDGLGGEIGRGKNGRSLAGGIEAKHFGGSATSGVENALRIHAQGPEIGSVGVGNQGKFWGEFEAAVTADGYAVGGAFDELVIGSLAPAAGVLGTRGERENRGKNDGGKQKTVAGQ